MTSSLEVTDAQSAAVQKTPHRVTLEHVNESIDSVEYINPESVPHFTLAVVRMNNGYVVTGESAPADPHNFNKDLGQAFALENAKRKIWPLLGFDLCQRLACGDAGVDPAPQPEQNPEAAAAA